MQLSTFVLRLVLDEGDRDASDSTGFKMEERVLDCSEDGCSAGDAVCLVISPCTWKGDAAQSSKLLTHVLEDSDAKRVEVVLPDDLQIWNLATFKNKNLRTNNALMCARKICEPIEASFRQAIANMGLSDTVSIVKWDEATSNSWYATRRLWVAQQYEENMVVKENIDQVVASFFCSRREKGECNGEKRGWMTNYVLDELPTLMDGFFFGDHFVRTIYHPVVSTDGHNSTFQHRLGHLLSYFRKSHATKGVLHDIDMRSLCDKTTVAEAGHSLEHSSSERKVGVDWLEVILWFPRFVLQLLVSLACMLLAYQSGAAKWVNSEGKVIPSSPLHSLSGDLPDLRADQRARFWVDKRKSLGHPDVYRVWFGPKPFLVIADPEAAQVFYRDQLKHPRMPDLGMGWMLVELFRNGVGFLEAGERWRLMHKLFGKAFGSANVQRITSLISSSCQDALASGGTFHAQKRLKSVLFQSTKALIYGTNLVTKEEEAKMMELADMEETVLESLFDGDWATWQFMRPFPTASKAILERFLSEWNQLNRQLLSRAQERRRKKNGDEGDDFAASVLAAAMDEEGNLVGVSEKELFDTVNEALLGPIHGSAGLLAWCLILLGSHKEVQEKLRYEVTHILGDDANVTADKMEQMPYLDAVLNEVNRLKPIFTYTVPEMTAQDSVIGGYFIPAGTNVTVDVVSLNTCKNVWENPLSFHPERFLQASRTTEERYSLHGFGLGPRKCIGQNVTKLAAKTLLCHVVRKFQISMDLKFEEVHLKKHPFIFVPDCDVTLTPL